MFNKIKPYIQILLLLVVFSSGTRILAYEWNNGAISYSYTSTSSIIVGTSYYYTDHILYTGATTTISSISFYAKSSFGDSVIVASWINGSSYNGSCWGSGMGGISTSSIEKYSIPRIGYFATYCNNNDPSSGYNIIYPNTVISFSHTPSNWGNQDFTTYYNSNDEPIIAINGSLPDDPYEEINNSTHIITLEPENNSFATSTGTTTDVIYNFEYNIAEEDIGKTFSVQVFLKNYDQNTLFGGLSDYQIEFLDFVATSSGIGGVSGYMSLPNGNYMIKGQLKTSLWGFTLPKIGIIDEKENQFIVGTSTYLGNLVQNSRNALNGALASTSAMSFASSSNTCNPFSGSVSTLYFNTNFNPISCFVFLFVPDQTLINESLTNVKNNVLQSFPIGYVTDFITIMATTSTTTLTVIDATLPNVLPGGGARVQLNLSHALDWALYATSSKFNNASASSTKTLYEITNEYWKIIVYIGALLYILSRLLGPRLIPVSLLDHNKQPKQ